MIILPKFNNLFKLRSIQIVSTMAHLPYKALLVKNKLLLRIKLDRVKLICTLKTIRLHLRMAKEKQLDKRS